MNPDLDALAIRLYVTIDDLLIDHPEWAPERPVIGIKPKLNDTELITSAVIQALLGFTSEARFWPHANTHLTGQFPYLPQRHAYNKRFRNAAATMQHIIAALARHCPSWNDALWLVNSTPVECGRSRETVKRSDMAGLAASLAAAGSGESSARSAILGDLLCTPIGDKCLRPHRKA